MGTHVHIIEKKNKTKNQQQGAVNKKKQSVL